MSSNVSSSAADMNHQTEELSYNDGEWGVIFYHQNELRNLEIEEPITIEDSDEDLSAFSDSEPETELSNEAETIDYDPGSPLYSSSSVQGTDDWIPFMGWNPEISYDVQFSPALDDSIGDVESRLK